MKAPLRYLVLATTVVIGGLALGLQLKSSEADPQKEFIGQDSCMACHAGPYGTDGRSYAGAAAFRETMHQKIHLRPNPQTVVIDRLFAKDTVLRYYDPAIPAPPHDTLEIHLSKGALPTDYYVQMKFSNGGDSTEKLKVAYTYGGNGWIQRYLLERNGKLYVAPFQYVLPRYRDRSDNSNGFYILDNTRWYNINEDREPYFYKANSKVFLQQQWQSNCAPCHINGTKIEKMPVPGSSDSVWTTKWFGVDKGDSALIDQNIKVGCESCHGPGSAHAADPTDPNGIVSPSRWPADAPGESTTLDLKVQLCGQCHDRIKSTGAPSQFTGNDTLPSFQFVYNEKTLTEYRPGQNMKDYVFNGNMFYGGQYWDDHVTSSAHHQQGQDFLRSGGYQQHVFSNGCWSCHLVHYSKDSLPYQLKSNFYSLTKGEGCLAYGCHETMDETTIFKGREVNKHTMHSVAISQCVNCHMTKTATISFVQLSTKPLNEFTDHSLRVIRPSVTRQYQNTAIVGALNTCAESCHRNGRGSRNSDPGQPEAPSYGIVDKILNKWNDRTDVALADSLEAHWNEMFPASAVMESSGASTTAIQSILPNPTRGAATVRFSLAKAGSITLEVFDMQGNMIKSLASGNHESGVFTQAWDGTDETGVQVASGTYLVRLVTKQGVSTERLVLAR
jgi:hypothetical protein